MKKILKSIIIVLFVLMFCIIIDIVSVYTRNKPIFAISKDCLCVDRVYYGLFYDTYNCIAYPTPQIIMKWSKFSCPKSELNKILAIIDLTKKNKNLVCAEALEKIYEDEENIYYLSCIKSQYIIVKYSNGYEENVKDALNNKHISILDLNTYGIEFIKENKS